MDLLTGANASWCDTKSLYHHYLPYNTHAVTALLIYFAFYCQITFVATYHSSLWNMFL